MINPDLRLSDLYPILASGDIARGRAVVATTPASSGEQRGKQADAVGQNIALASVPRFLGVSPDAITDAYQGSLQMDGRIRAQGGAAIVAPALITFDANGRFVTYTHDATKFGMVCGYAATDCSGANAFFDLVLAPMLLGPASATTDDFTLTGTLEAEHIHSTDDAVIDDDLSVGGDFALTGNMTSAAGNITLTAGTVSAEQLTSTDDANITGTLTAGDAAITGAVAAGSVAATGTVQAEQLTSTDDAAVAGLLTVGEFIEITEMVAPAAPAANKARIYCVDNGGKVELVVLFPTGVAIQLAIEA